MSSIKYIFWQEDATWLGYLEDYPDYWTQGETFDDLLEHLRDLYLDLSQGQIPGGAQSWRTSDSMKRIDLIKELGR